MTHLRAVPDLREDHVHAVALTPEHGGRTITIRGKDGTALRARLDSTAPSLTTGFTVLYLTAVGTSITLALPNLAPIYIHPQETP